MEFIEKIVVEDKCIAIVLRSEFSVDKTTFFSEPQYSQQLGIIKYPAGGHIRPHFHNEISRVVMYTQEILFIRKGKVLVHLYDEHLSHVKDIILNTGDLIFLITGGHGFEMLEDCEMVEVKQGPYSGTTNDKTHFGG
jgi:hypothetical protein